MNNIVKDIKVITVCSKMLKCLCVIRTALTVGIIVFSVLEGMRYFTKPDMMKKLMSNMK